MAFVSKFAARSGAPRWLITFADLMALLLSLFVLILSFSEIDSDSFRRNAGPISEAFHSKNILQISSPTSPVAKRRSFKLDLETVEDAKDKAYFREAKEKRERLFDRLRIAMASEIAQRLVELEIKDNTVVIRFPDKSAFPAGSADLSHDIVPTLERIAGILARSEGNILVAGHTDNVPISTSRYRSNWDLSASRAVSVVHQLLEDPNIKPGRVLAQGFADNRPLSANATPEGRSKNRRVEISVEVTQPGRPSAPGPRGILSK